MALFGSLTPTAAALRFDDVLRKAADKNHAKPLQVSLSSQKLGLAYADSLGENERPFHIASIGKVFTAALVFMLAEDGAIGLDSPLADYLPRAQLDKLFAVRGIDYAPKVTIRHLLGHTSGAADYFEDPVVGGRLFLEDVLAHPNTFWTPEMLLDVSRERQKPAAEPGKLFHYSDTGYILLGKLIEAVTRQPFQASLHARIFEPLGMRDSYLMFYSEPLAQPKQPIQPIWVNGQEISRFTSLSCDWAGGGIISTPADLLSFSRALAGGKLVSAESYAAMRAFDHKFRRGIHYGLGLMEVHFEEFFFLLRGMPRMTGHIGILATHMFYDPVSDTHIAMNFGATDRMTQSFRVLIDLMGIIRRIKVGGA
jgi:D-alanyl-D-alanine carboxypeptidase